MPGPRAQSFIKWLRSVNKGGACKKLRVFCDDGEKMVVCKTAPATVKLVEGMNPSSVEALDGDGTLLGEWSFADPNEEAKDEEHGYDLKEGDNDQVRMMKTFAHLIADAHKVAVQRVVDVVKIQSEHFSEERKSMVSLRMQVERQSALLQKLQAKALRLRVATDENEDEDENFLQDLIAPIIAKNLAAQAQAAAGGDDETPPNGKGKAS